jgi:hypothetical protein
MKLLATGTIIAAFTLLASGRALAQPQAAIAARIGEIR